MTMTICLINLFYKNRNLNLVLIQKFKKNYINFKHKNDILIESDNN
jgi:hypothetical protein